MNNSRNRVHSARSAGNNRPALTRQVKGGGKMYKEYILVFLNYSKSFNTEKEAREYATRKFYGNDVLILKKSNRL